jgi:hypothetical protein
VGRKRVPSPAAGMTALRIMPVSPEPYSHAKPPSRRG